MAFVTLDSNNNVKAIFNLPQTDSTLVGYTIIDDNDPRIATYLSNRSSKDNIIAQLGQLDFFIPRGLEDFWAASNFDTTTLPSIQQTRLATKRSLRTQLAALT